MLGTVTQPSAVAMPCVSFLLEGLVTTLLSLGYLHHQVPETTLVPANKQLPLRIPSPCRSSALSFSSSDESSESSSTSTGTGIMDSNHKSLPDGTCEYHRPPADDSNSDSQSYYDKHDTVFGRILRGELPAITLAESTRLLAIQDLKPRAPLHALIIPKGFVGSVFDVTGDDQEWMEEMKSMALDLVQAQHPQAFAKGDYRLCFHIPPFNSVNHLHLHVLAPASTMGIYYKYVKYLPGTRWCIEMDEVMTRLQQHMSPVPYQRPPMCPTQTQDMTAAAATAIPKQAKSSSCQSEEKEKDSC